MHQTQGFQGELRQHPGGGYASAPAHLWMLLRASSIDSSLQDIWAVLRLASGENPSRHLQNEKQLFSTWLPVTVIPWDDLATVAANIPAFHLCALSHVVCLVFSILQTRSSPNPPSQSGLIIFTPSISCGLYMAGWEGKFSGRQEPAVVFLVWVYITF